MLFSSKNKHPLTPPPKFIGIQGGPVGWVVESEQIRDLLAKGCKVRIKNATYAEGENTSKEDQTYTKVMVYLPRKNVHSGRRLIEVSCRLVSGSFKNDVPTERLRVTVFGPNRTLTTRERIFDDYVANRVEALE